MSLIALGQIRRRHFDDTLTLRPKKTRNATEELESPQEIEIAARTEQIETTAPGARPYRDHFPFDEATLLRLIAASLPLPLIEYYCNGGVAFGSAHWHPTVKENVSGVCLKISLLRLRENEPQK